MWTPFFCLAAVSPTRRATFRHVLVAHLGLLALGAWAVHRQGPGQSAVLLGNLLLVAGIIEGATLLGWRLTQLPRSQALEFLLVSSIRPRGLFAAEALVGIAQLGLITLAGFPVLALLAGLGYLAPIDLAALTVMPFTWGVATGLGLTAWAYESAAVRRWGERLAIVLVVLYLIVGILAGEKLRQWVDLLPPDARVAFLDGYIHLHTRNPFGVMRDWLDGDPDYFWDRAVWLQGVGTVLIGLLLWRGAARLRPHFHHLHYQPLATVDDRRRPPVGDRPLTWWAVKRVSQYSGRINLWLAGGFGLLYAAYTLAGPHWPAWMGRRVFALVDGAGGIAGLTTGLVLLAAVPAAFQYGLWDSNVPDRCRRLELLLLTDLRPRDYWHAAAAAAWSRGRGYFAIAILLWAAACVAGRMTAGQALTALAAGVLLWSLYFTLGFRAFARGAQANGLGMMLTVGLPFLAYAMYRLDLANLAVLLPPGVVYAAGANPASASWLIGPLAAGLVALTVARLALARADADLRRWYDAHQGVQVVG